MQFQKLFKNKQIYKELCIKEEEKTIWMDEFVNSINIEYPKMEYKPPKYEFIPSGVESKEYLITLAKKGLTKRLKVGF